MLLKFLELTLKKCMEFTLNCALTLRVLRLTYSPLQPFIVSSRNAPLLGGRPRLSLRVARLTFFFYVNVLISCLHADRVW